MAQEVVDVCAEATKRVNDPEANLLSFSHSNPTVKFPVQFEGHDISLVEVHIMDPDETLEGNDRIRMVVVPKVEIDEEAGIATATVFVTPELNEAVHVLVRYRNCASLHGYLKPHNKPFKPDTGDAGAS